MNKKVVIKEMDLNGRKLKLETGVLAKQADASVFASWGDTVLLCTVSTKTATEDKGYFPLSVEYVEKYYAGGIITSQKFIKKETRPSDEAILSGRAIDRAVRPLFPKDSKDEVQVVITVMSYDGVNDPALLGFIATSAALTISSVPWAGPLSATRIGKTDGSIVVNPELSLYSNLDLNLLVASTKEKVAMIEAGANEVDDKVVFDSIKQAHDENQKVIELIEQFAKEAGKEKKTFAKVTEEIDVELLSQVKAEIKEKIEAALFDKDHTWHEATGDLIKQELGAAYAEKLTPVQVSSIFDKVAKEIMHDTVLNKGKRVDGRAMDEVRPINIKLGVLPRTHGSALFERGETQVLAIVTLGSTAAAQTLEGMTGESVKRFMHHYNMSINPFATGEVKKIGSPGRRDIGHGALVEKGLLAVIPAEEEFPYAIRVVSEVLAANASTSMASLCASTLALLNAGVELKNPVAGIALGLLSEGDKFQVITDMQAVEDFYGEMDFKVTGTVKGVTAIQMDTKLTGLTFEIIEEALKQGKKAREMIIGKINEAIPAAGELSKYAPKIQTTKIKPEEIGLLIGSGGKTINALIARTGTQIDINDDGTVMVSSTDEEAIKKTLEIIKTMFTQVEPGQTFEGKVVKLMPFGAFVEIAPGKEGLVHVSQMAPYRVETPEDIVSVGQTVKVRVVELNPEGKINLSMLFGADIKDREPGEQRRDYRSGDRHGGRGGFEGRERRRFGKR